MPGQFFQGPIIKGLSQRFVTEQVVFPQIVQAIRQGLDQVACRFPQNDDIQQLSFERQILYQLYNPGGIGKKIGKRQAKEAL